MPVYSFLKEVNTSSKAKNSLAIVSVGYFISKFIDIIKNIILARLLLPTDFGVVALALFLTELLRQVARSEFNSAIIQKKSINDSVLYTGYTFSLISIVGVIVIAFFGADIYASYYDTESIAAIVKVISISFILFALGFIPETICSKELEFGKIVVAEVFAVFSSLVIAVVLATMGFGHWSIVWGIVAKFSLYQIGIYLMKPSKLKLVFDFNNDRKLFSFGSKVLLTTILVFIGNKIPDAIIGKTLGLAALGYYTLAFRWGGMGC